MDDPSEAERSVWTIVQDFFSDIRLNPQAIVALYSLIEPIDTVTSDTSPEQRNAKLVWDVGPKLMYEVWQDCASYDKSGCSCNSPADLDFKKYFSLDMSRDIWIRILHVSDPVMLNRLFHAAF